MEYPKDSFQISPHAIERFKERWKILKGILLEESNVLPELQGLIMRSEPEPDNPALLKRREKHGGEHRYMISGPWRLVWQDNRLITVELRNLGVTLRPKLYSNQVRVSFFLRATEYENFTLIERSIFKGFSSGLEKAVFWSKPEVNAIIRFLRLIGAEVGYKRTGTEHLKQAIISILLPKELRKFEIAELEERKIRFSISDQERPYRIVGITGDACREIFSFIIDQAWLSRIEPEREAVRSEKRLRAQIKLQRRQEQEQNIQKKRELWIEQKKQHQINCGKKTDKISIKKLWAGIPKVRTRHSGS
ncbi:MAG: hypothetical protein ABIG29_02550 [Candidatus Nealsonbacteria bacterium]